MNEQTVIAYLIQNGYTAVIEYGGLTIGNNRFAIELQWPLRVNWTPLQLVWTARSRLFGGTGGWRFPPDTCGPSWDDLLS